MAFKKKEEEITNEETTIEEIKPKLVSKDKHSFQSLINQAKQEAFKKHVCTISYNDKRDSDKITTAYLTCENQYFSIASIICSLVTSCILEYSIEECLDIVLSLTLYLFSIVLDICVCLISIYSL
ncbi:hypothetical protein P9I23_001243 [Campylobacter fetus]|uniref:hypothetical protein n=1 Tax=Campylobacter fetus TaxID=196 RepID=UPI0011877D0A|nr:hypothetical protein [Campylobacter fetus]EKR8080628.1 hypothetical protein [Campylobacter fetus]QDS05343.1 hypothetical protein FP572_09085 [Campylobacter fetus subsp. fetus]